MKTRLGFVSNSSSSSFTLITSEDEHNRIVAELPQWAQAMVPSLVGFTTIGTQKLVVFQANSGEAFYDDPGAFYLSGVNVPPKEIPVDCPYELEPNEAPYDRWEAFYQARDAYKKAAKRLGVKGIMTDLQF